MWNITTVWIFEMKPLNSDACIFVKIVNYNVAPFLKSKMNSSLNEIVQSVLKIFNTESQFKSSKQKHNQ